MRRRTRCLALLVFLVQAFLGPSEAKASKSDEELATRLDRMLSEAYLADEPGAAVIITRDGSQILRKAYGMADLELGVPMEPDMVFRLGSITKQFTASAILLLEQQGKLSVKDSITKYLPNYPVHGLNITIEHLLSHTSGIFNVTSIPGYMKDSVRRDLKIDELIQVFSSQPMEFPPGQLWSYSNSGYVLLGAIIERVSGQSYAEFIERDVFTPLGMTNSYYGGHQIIPRRVSGYQGRSGQYRNADYLSMTQPHAAGSLLSTIDDLARWDAALYTGQLLTRKSFEKMTTRFRLNDGETTDYGYGFLLSTLRGHPVVEHAGGIHGFVASAMRIPDERIYIAILSNNPGRRPGPGYWVRKIGAEILGNPFTEWKEVQLDSEVLSRYVGAYRINDDLEEILTVENGKLYTQQSGRRKQQALPASATNFFYKNSLTYFELVLDPSGNLTHMLIYENGADEPKEAQRVSDQPLVGRD